MKVSLSLQQLRFLRLKAQGLLPAGQKVDSAPVRVAARMAGAQAQDLPAAILSIGARGAHLTEEGVRHARLVERSLLWTWCLRGTLHLLPTSDALWLLPLLGSRLIIGDRRRMQQLGWEEENTNRALRLLQQELQEHGSLTRTEIIRLLERNHLPAQGQAPIHLIFRAALQGLLCYGPRRDKDTAFVTFDAWAGHLQPLERDEALALLARRYLEAFGPASPHDLAAWAGLPVREAQAGWQRIQAELAQVETPFGEAWLLQSRLDWLGEASRLSPSLKLLPRFDTLWMGYASRDWLVDSLFARRIQPGGGIIHPMLLVDGQARGTWKTIRRKTSLEVHVQPFESLSVDIIPFLREESTRLGRFLGLDIVLTGLDG